MTSLWSQTLFTSVYSSSWASLQILTQFPTPSFSNAHPTILASLIQSLLGFSPTSNRTVYLHKWFHFISCHSQTIIIYVHPLYQIICKHGLYFRCYADDSQLYPSTSPLIQFQQSLVNCLQAMKVWMTIYMLKVSSNRNELLVVDPKGNATEVGRPTAIF